MKHTRVVMILILIIAATSVGCGILVDNYYYLNLPNAPIESEGVVYKITVKGNVVKYGTKENADVNAIAQILFNTGFYSFWVLVVINAIGFKLFPPPK